MKKPLHGSVLTVVVAFCLFFGSFCYGAARETQADRSGQTPVILQEQTLALQEGCLAATITAVELEMERYQNWISIRKQHGDQTYLAELEASLALLQADLDKYKAMNAQDYVVPEAFNTTAWVEYKAKKNSALYVDGMSKNGPWYHVAGIQGGDYTQVRGNTKYNMKLYEVYPRLYGSMKSAYVFVGELPSQQSKRIRGNVFERSHGMFVDSAVKCDAYQLFLIKNLQAGTKGELLLDSKQSSFDITLSEQQLKEYLYIEVVSRYGSRVLKIDEIQDGTITIVLERDVVIKKPAIYLYPERKMKVEVVHRFKGTLLNTYPAYNDNWTVIAEPSGNLFNPGDKRNYKYLFWDGRYAFPQEHYNYKTGFYVKREEYVAFLQTKLQWIGLTSDEINDFIVYWLPAMSRYPNCFVHFRINDDIGGSSVLETTPKPQTMIRVFMEFSGMDRISEAGKLPEQTLPAFARKGFTLIEWGGSEIGHNTVE